MGKIKERLIVLYDKRELLEQLVRRDIRLKYRRSVLGYFWSIMNPLLIMLVLTAVFSNLFRRYNMVNYPVYVIIGRAVFDFFQHATSQGMLSIIGNANLIRKIYVPKYIFTLASVTSAAVDFIFSLGAIAIVMIITRTVPSWYVLLLPFVIVQLYVFCLGFSFFLAAATVFFRDTRYIYNALMLGWMFVSAIFYPASILPEKLLWFVSNFNPMFIYIGQARDLILYGAMPPCQYILTGTLWALVTFFIGMEIFRRTQDSFILYI
ncbi:ABC transporter permease [Synergistes jonesii]|uniref:ABC transporter permease n=1 Tax=Synergistes jonesii TaxID=2754 RepID=UPI003323A70A